MLEVSDEERVPSKVTVSLPKRQTAVRPSTGWRRTDFTSGARPAARRTSAPVIPTWIPRIETCGTIGKLAAGVTVAAAPGASASATAAASAVEGRSTRGILAQVTAGCAAWGAD
jgi:hypothetical protein